MTKVISLFNQAGGVAKTTTAQNLGYHLSERRYRVLLVDIDPHLLEALRAGRIEYTKAKEIAKLESVAD